MFVLRGVDLEGNVSFYTGRAGAGWLSADIAEAFTYDAEVGARRKATLFNSWGGNVRFIAYPREGRPE